MSPRSSRPTGHLLADEVVHRDDPSPQADEVLEAVGPRLRSLRQRNGATLAELSASTGISVSTLSRLESGRRRPTLELLLALARAHQVTLDELVETTEPDDPRVRTRPTMRHRISYLPLTRRSGGLQAYKVVFPPRWPRGTPDQRSHEGYEWLYVLSGRLRLVLGDQDLFLELDEVVEFDTRVPHWLANPDPTPAEALFLFGPQGERLHVRARSRPT